MSQESTKKSTSNLNTFVSGQANLDVSNPESQYITQQYQNTPIWIRGNSTDGYFLTVGDYRLTDALPTIGDLEKLLKRRDLNLLVMLISAIVETHLREEAKNKAVSELQNITVNTVKV